MANFTISKATQKTKTWMAIGNNPITGKPLCIQGGRAGSTVGGSAQRIKAFNTRHEASGISPTKYINALRWQNEAPFDSVIDIPDELFYN